MNTGTTLKFPNPPNLLPFVSSEPVITRAPASAALSGSDRRMLRRALGKIKAVRADAKSLDAKVAGQAKQRHCVELRRWLP